MRHALETALADYAGAMVLVSHDRHLLTATCDDFWLVANGRCEPFEGDLDDYARLLSVRDSSAPSPSRAADSARDLRRSGADQRERARPLRDTVKKLDAQMAKLQKRLAELDARLADPALYAGTPPAEVAQLGREQTELRTQLAALEEQWLAAAGELEQLQ
jgi:ATP-binding cassette, subfamily F, member 3